MDDYRQKYYNLYQFLGGYFHQDWKDDYGWDGEEPTFEAVVRHYKTEDTAGNIGKTVGELTELLALPLDDSELHRIIEEDFSSWYTPRSRGMNKRQFLERVLEVLKEPAETARPLKRVA